MEWTKNYELKFLGSSKIALITKQVATVSLSFKPSLKSVNNVIYLSNYVMLASIKAATFMQ